MTASGSGGVGDRRQRQVGVGDAEESRPAQRRIAAVPRRSAWRHVAGKAPADLVFPAPGGGPLRKDNFRRRVFEPAARAVGLDGLTPHGLRHTAASLATASGADIKVVQAMLGHESAELTLDLYGHLYADRLDGVADQMDAARMAALDGRLPNEDRPAGCGEAN